MLSNLLAETLAAQSTEARAIAAVAALLQGNLLTTFSSLSLTDLATLSTQLIAQGYGGLMDR